MSGVETTPPTRDGRSDRELLEDRFDDRRHVLKRIVELDGPLSDDARQILEIIGESGTSGSSTATESTRDAGPFCPSCGEGIESGDAFCRHCGGELPGGR